MRWGYSSLSALMWAGFVAYVVILGLLFILISRGRNKKKVFNMSAILLVAVQSVLLISLGLNDSAASVKKFGFEVWVCGKQVQVADSSPAGRILEDGAYFSEKMVNINSDDSQLRVGEQLSSAGASIADNMAQIPISSDFELKVAGDTNLEWLSGNLKYANSDGSDSPSVAVKNASLTCPNGDLGTWNAFIARVDNQKQTYAWQKLTLAELSAALVRASDGSDIPDCVILDFDADKGTSEHRCADILKNDAERCTLVEASKCSLKEVKN